MARNRLIFFIVCVICITSCKDKNKEPDRLEVAPVDLEFVAENPETQTVMVTTNVTGWNVSTTCGWLNYNKEANSFTITVFTNDETGERTGTVTVEAGNAEPVTVTVKQLAFVEEKAELAVTTAELEFGVNDAQPQTVTVESSLGRWDATPSDDWITTGNTTDGFTVTVQRSFVPDVRTGTITVTSGNADPKYVTVAQAAYTPADWAADPALQVLKAFPGAEGFGSEATGGRGGRVVVVTTLADNANSPPTGSLRWALNQHGDNPKIIVFAVSGIIELKGELRKVCKNVTIAGQTAPGDGVCITGNKVNLGGSSNLIIRHIRSRIGNSVHESAIGIENASNFIIDHCTFGWSGEENMTVYDNNMTTVQWCIIHEGLFDSGHAKGDRGYGTQWGGENATYHHNLLAHNDSRSPRFNGARSTANPGYPKDCNVLIDFVNNVNFNWGRQGSSYGADITVATNSHRANFVNNYWKPGPARPATGSSWFVRSSYGGLPDNIAVWWMSGNVMEGNANYTANNYSGLGTDDYPAGTNPSLFRANAPFAVTYPVTAETAQQAYESVLAGAGAFPRDAVDARIVSEVRNPNLVTVVGKSGRRGIIDQISSVGGHAAYRSLKPLKDTDGDGIPDDWETCYGLNPNDPDDGNATNLSGGTYTNLEVYLYSLTVNN